MQSEMGGGGHDISDKVSARAPNQLRSGKLNSGGLNIHSNSNGKSFKNQSYSKNHALTSAKRTKPSSTKN